MTFDELLRLKNSDPAAYEAAWGDQALKVAGWVTWNNFSERTTKEATFTGNTDLGALRNTVVNKWDTDFVNISPTNSSKVVSTQNIATNWSSTEWTTINSVSDEAIRDWARSNILNQIRSQNSAIINDRKNDTQVAAVNIPSIVTAPKTIIPSPTISQSDVNTVNSEGKLTTAQERRWLQITWKTQEWNYLGSDGREYTISERTWNYIFLP